MKTPSNPTPPIVTLSIRQYVAEHGESCTYIAGRQQIALSFPPMKIAG